MFIVFVLVFILAGVNGRISEPAEKLLDIVENIIDIDNIELKSTLSDVTTESTRSTQSEADQKVNRNDELHEHEDVDSMNKINKEHTSYIVDKHAGINTSENKTKENKNINEEHVTSTPVHEGSEKENKIIDTTESTGNVTVITSQAKNERATIENNSTLMSTTESNQTKEESNKTETSSDRPYPEPSLHTKPDLNDTTTIPNIKDIETDNQETALKLTPYIKEGLLEQARNASEVNSTMFLDYKSYSGYLTVDERYDSNTFFWYFPVEGKQVEKVPWIIWLQGGPGYSSMYGLFHEIGPFTVDKELVLHKNPYSWLQNHSLVFIDNPVGVGFSFTKQEDDYATNIETYSAHLYEATRQLLLLFPELQRAPLYVAGESYAGKYVPSLALELHKHKDEITINLQGIMLGNALIEPQSTLSARTWLNMGVLDADEARALQPDIDLYNLHMAAGNYRNAAKKWQDIGNFLLLHSYQENLFNYLREGEDPTQDTSYVKFLRSVRRALHASNNYSTYNRIVYDILESEHESVQPKIEALLEHYEVLAYCGNLDLIFHCATAAENHRKWNWTGSEEFSLAPRSNFRFNDSVAGYFKTGGRFTEAVVIGAGHMVPADKPAVMQDLITKWTHGKSLGILPKWSNLYRLLQSKNIRDRAIVISYISRNAAIKAIETTTIEASTTEAETSNATNYNEVEPVQESSNDKLENLIEQIQVLVSESVNSTNRPTNETENQTTETSTKEAATTEAQISNDITDHNKEQQIAESSNYNGINETHVAENESLNWTNQVTNKTPIQTTETATMDVSTTETEIRNDTSDDNKEQNLALEGPLILTSYIKEGLLEQARNASEVNSTLFLGYKSYSGFFTVNETYNSNTFFWYFPVEGKLVEDAPWIIWLQGGPGITSLFGLTSEVGPFTPGDRAELIKNPNSWLQNHSLVFIDNPVGVGFSFTEHEDGYAKDMETYSAHLYEATRQLLLLFPELQRAPLYVAGESYAGKYVPSLALELHKHKDEITVNLQGLLVGNGYIDPAMLANFSRSFYDFGLLSPEDMQDLRSKEALFDEAVLAKNSSMAKDVWVEILMDILQRTNLQQSYNFLHSNSWAESLLAVSEIVESFDVKQAIHVGNVPHSLYNITVNKVLKPEFLTSSKEKYEELMEHYRVLLYCGQLDQMMACGTASEFHRTFKWSGHDAFVAAHKEGFTFNGTLTAYHKTGGNLTEAVIRGAGHMVPVDKGAPLREFVTRWTHRLPFPGLSFTPYRRTTSNETDSSVKNV